MHVSIWQQFNSNHSGGFDIVGIFDSADSAEKASQQLRMMLKKIAEVRSQIDFDEEDHDNIGIPPTHVELEFAEQLAVEWGMYSIDWITTFEDAVGDVQVSNVSEL